MPPSRLEDRLWLPDGRYQLFAGPGLLRKLKPGICPFITQVARGWKLEIYRVHGTKDLVFQEICNPRTVVGAKQAMMRKLEELDLLLEKNNGDKQQD